MPTYAPPGDWGGYWGKQGPEFLTHRLAAYEGEQPSDEIVRRMKAESDTPIRSHGSLSLNRTLLAAGLVDRVQITVFPVISAQTGDEPIFAGAGDYDLDLLESGTFDGRIQELVYRPTLHTWPAG